MKKVFILLILAVALLTFAYFWLFVPSERTSEMGSGDEVVGAEEVVEPVVQESRMPESGRGTLAELRAYEEHIECSITYQTDEFVELVEGTYFVADGDVRGDFLTPAPDLSGQVLSSVIVADDVMHVWSEIDGEAYGVRIDLTQFSEDEVERNEPVSFDEPVDYQCRAWENVDRTIFMPPGEVLFQDFGAVIRSGMEYGTVYEEEGARVPEF